MKNNYDYVVEAETIKNTKIMKRCSKETRP